MARLPVRGWRESSDQITRWNTPKDIVSREVIAATSVVPEIEQHKERRKQRRLLRESGDYLGVQGVNPQTGELDVVTPTPSNSSHSTRSLEAKQRLLDVEKRAHAVRATYQKTIASMQEDARNILLQLKQDKQTEADLQKKAIRAAQKKVR